LLKILKASSLKKSIENKISGPTKKQQEKVFDATMLNSIYSLAQIKVFS